MSLYNGTFFNLTQRNELVVVVEEIISRVWNIISREEKTAAVYYGLSQRVHYIDNAKAIETEINSPDQ